MTAQSNFISSTFKILRIFSVTFVADSEQPAYSLGVVSVLAEISRVLFCWPG